MTFSKKFRKLRRDPKAFFADSKSPSLQRIAALMHDTPLIEGLAIKTLNPLGSNLKLIQKPIQKPAPTPVSKPVVQLNKTKVPVKKPAVVAKESIDAVRSMVNEFEEADLWRVYREEQQDHISVPEAETIIAVYPLGVRVMDSERMAQYRSEGCAAFFLPLWNSTDRASDLDDLEFQAGRSPAMANSIARQLLDVAVARKATIVLLPYDATALTRAIVIQCRGLGLITICHLPSYSPVLQLYGGNRLASFPISDWIAVDDQFAKKLRFPEAVMRRCSLIQSNTENSPREQKGNELQHYWLRSLLGVGPVEDIRFIALPPLQLSKSNESVNEIVLSQLEELLSRTQPTDHLIIVAKRRKRGFINDFALKLLQKKYRKTVLLYDEEIDFSTLLSIAKEAVLPVGLLSKNFCGNLKVTTYGLDAVQKNTPENLAGDVSGSENGELSLEDGQACCTLGFQHLGFDKLVNRSCSKFIEGKSFSVFEDVLERIFDKVGPGLDIISVPDPVTNIPITDGRQKYLLELLHANRRVYGAGSFTEAIMSEVFVQWGAEPSESKERPEIFRSNLARSRLFLEDGFIRSQGLWTDPNEPTLSVVIDTRAIYYNSLQPSLLEEMLNSDFKLSDAQLKRARNLIDSIVCNRISKYNHAPVLDLNFRSEGKKTILIIDQKAGDMSIKYGSATDESFFSMLQSALDLGGDVEIVIKQHPCAISGGAHEAHFTAESLGALTKQDNVHLIGFDVNPYSLINAVDEVWVVSSGMGFEALMAGKPVRCFGVPFYANWGITQDEVRIDRRSNQRSLEEIFYVFYVMLSRYVDPLTEKLCDIERLIEYFSTNANAARV